MDEDVQRYFELGLAPSTKRTYKAGIAKFTQFCSIFQIHHPLPVSQSTLCSYITYLAKSGLAFSTIKTYLSAIRHLHILHDLPPFGETSMPKFELVKRGILRSAAGRSNSLQRLPVTPFILRQIKALWSTCAQSYESVMIWAVCCTAFFGFFRIGELLETTSSGHQGLSMNDIAVDSLSEPSAIQIHLRRSKTDQYGQGVDIYLGRTEGDICPVTALLAYLGVRGSSGGPLFKYSDGKALTKQCFVAKVREALEALGYDSKVYAGHSFRIGAATTAAERVSRIQ